MNLNLNTKPITVPTKQLETPSALKVHSIGGIALAGLFGGPIASAYLTFRNLQLLGHPNPARKVLVWFVPLTAVWLFISYKSHSDVISQLIPYLPQVFIWWLIARYFLKKSTITHRSLGGGFKSKFFSAGFGLLTTLTVRIVEFAIYFLLSEPII
jgi:hypothetical protein